MCIVRNKIEFTGNITFAYSASFEALLSPGIYFNQNVQVCSCQKFEHETKI